MAACTAPRRGHSTPSAYAACPACGKDTPGGRAMRQAALSAKVDSMSPAEMSRSPETWVRARAASMSTASVEVLRRLADDRDAIVRIAVAENPHAPTDLMVRLSKSRGTMASAVGNINFPADEFMVVVEACLAPEGDPEDPDSIEVLVEAACNPSCPPDVLESVAGHASEQVRDAVAVNANTPQPVLVRLMGHSDPAVAQDAEFALTCIVRDRLGIDTLNHDATDLLLSMDQWWEMQPADERVTLIRTMHPDV